MRVVRSGALILFVAATYAACSSEEDAGSSSSGTGGSAGSGVDSSLDATSGFETTTCGICVFDTCETQASACDADSDCAKYLSCLKGCGVDANGYADPACEASCPVPSAGTSAIAKAELDACRQFALVKACAACGMTASDAGQTCSPSTAVDECEKCLDETCCETSAACAKQPECAAIKDCGAACPSAGYADCIAGCFDAHPTGVAAYSTDLGCFLTLCADTPKCPWVNPGPCADCVLQSCSDVSLACNSDAECLLITLCIDPCVQPDLTVSSSCVLACEEGHSPEAIAKFEASLICRESLCSGPCG